MCGSSVEMEPLYLRAWRLYNGECRGDIWCVAQRLYGDASLAARKRAARLVAYARRRAATLVAGGYERCLALAAAHVEELRRHPEARHHEVLLPRIEDKRRLRGEERQYVEHEQLIYWLYTHVLGMSPEMHVWGAARVAHCRLFPLVSRLRRLRCWRTGRGWPPFSASCASWNYAFYLLDAVLLSYGMYGQRGQLLASRRRLLAEAKSCSHDDELYGIIHRAVLMPG